MNLLLSIILGNFVAIGVYCAVGVFLQFIASGRERSSEVDLTLLVVGLSVSVGVVSSMLSYGVW